MKKAQVLRLVPVLMALGLVCRARDGAGPGSDVLVQHGLKYRWVTNSVHRHQVISSFERNGSPEQVLRIFPDSGVVNDG